MVKLGQEWKYGCFCFVYHYFCIIIGILNYFIIIVRFLLLMLCFVLMFAFITKIETEFILILKIHLSWKLYDKH